MTGRTEPDGELAVTVLDSVRRLVAELNPGRSPLPVHLDSSLQRDLALDSLALVELRERLERSCEVRLSDRALAEVDTPREWVHAVMSAVAGAPSSPGGPQVTEGLARAVGAVPVGEPPPAAQTLGDVLSWHCAARPEAVQVCLLDHSGAAEQQTELTYAVLHRQARAVAHGLVGHEVEPGQTVGIMLPTGLDYFATFLGVLLAGAVPVPIYPPFRAAGIGEHLLRQAGSLANAGVVALVTVPQALPLARLLRARVGSLRIVTTRRELSESGEGELAALRPDDIALLQYTSGSTGDPKGVVLTHRQLLANIRAMGAAIEAGPADRFVSWLPLYHDMGLIGAWLGALYFGFPLVVMSPIDFLARPSRWLWALHSHRATLSAGPNFAFELCLRRVPDDEIVGLHLSSLRMLFNGAEPVSPDTVRRFSERFVRYGFRPEAMAPVYGLLEAAVGLTFPPPGRGPVVDGIDRKAFLRDGRALPAPAADRAALRFVACGRPLPGYQVRVVDRAGRELPDRTEGRAEFAGPSATAGYYRAPEKTARLRRDAWLDTGDLGYIANGDLYVTARAKDLIVRAGRNLHPVELEEAVGRLPGVRAGCVAVFSTPEPRTGTERLVVLAETRETDPGRRDELRRRIVAAGVDLLGTPPDNVVLAPPGAVPKTSSGKIRRSTSRTRYESGLVGESAGPTWWQLARFRLGQRQAATTSLAPPGARLGVCGVRLGGAGADRGTDLAPGRGAAVAHMVLAGHPCGGPRAAPALRDTAVRDRSRGAPRRGPPRAGRQPRELPRWARTGARPAPAGRLRGRRRLRAPAGLGDRAATPGQRVRRTARTRRRHGR